MTNLSPAQEAAQNDARNHGRFGEQNHAHPGIVIDPADELAADLSDWMERLAYVRSLDSDIDPEYTDEWEDFDQESPDLLIGLAAEHRANPEVADLLPAYDNWRSDFQASVDAGDEGGNVDLSDETLRLLTEFAGRLNVTANEGNWPIEDAVVCCKCGQRPTDGDCGNGGKHVGFPYTKVDLSELAPGDAIMRDEDQWQITGIDGDHKSASIDFVDSDGDERSFEARYGDTFIRLTTGNPDES